MSAQARRLFAQPFYRVMNPLLDYANDTLGTSPLETVRLDATDPCELDEASLVLDALWTHPELVSSFVRENPAGLSEQDLEIARGWRHPVTDAFVFVDAEGDYATAMNAERLFVVESLVRRISSQIRAIPSLAVLTLIPYRGQVVTDGRVIHLSDRPRPDATSVISRLLSRATLHGPITGADELLAYAATHPASSKPERSWLIGQAPFL